MKTIPKTGQPDDASNLRRVIQNGIALNREFNIHFLARSLFMSRYTLHRHSVQATGLSPGRLILKLRLEQALHLLDQKKLSVSDIAFETGFNAVSHFSSEFKKQYGICPQKWQPDVGVNEFAGMELVS